MIVVRDLRVKNSGHPSEMDFLTHLQEYYKGERLGAIVFTIAGVTFLLLCFLLWKQTTAASLGRGLIYPMLLVGIGGTIAGPLLLRSNNDRLHRFPEEYRADARAFVAKETARLEGVNRAWIPLKITWTVLIAIGLSLAFMGGSPYWKGLGLGILLIGTLGHVVDGFAHERARVYTELLSAA